MIPYNTDLKKLVLPEYGRLVHNLVEICTTLEDRQQRTDFASAIVDVMKSVLQEKGKTEDDKKYWDHLFIMSEGKLDIDSPFGVPSLSAIKLEPSKVPYSSSDFGKRHYGKILQQMVKKVALMENSEEKDMYVELLSNHVKKLLVLNNPEYANDEKVYSDISEISGGTINIGTDVFDLPEFNEEKTAKNQKRKKNHA